MEARRPGDLPGLPRAHRLVEKLELAPEVTWRGIAGHVPFGQDPLRLLHRDARELGDQRGRTHPVAGVTPATADRSLLDLDVEVKLRIVPTFGTMNSDVSF